MNVYYNDYDALYEHIESLKPYCLHLWLAMGGEVTSPFMVPLKLLHMEREIGLIGGTQPQWYTLTFKQRLMRVENFIDTETDEYTRFMHTGMETQCTPNKSGELNSDSITGSDEALPEISLSDQVHLVYNKQLDTDVDMLGLYLTSEYSDSTTPDNDVGIPDLCSSSESSDFEFIGPATLVKPNLRFIRRSMARRTNMKNRKGKVNSDQSNTKPLSILHQVCDTTARIEVLGLRMQHIITTHQVRGTVSQTGALSYKHAELHTVWSNNLESNLTALRLSLNNLETKFAAFESIITETAATARSDVGY